MPSVLRAVWSCIRPGRTAPLHSVRPAWSLQVVVLIVFCLRLPDTNPRRPTRWARGLLTWVWVASMRTCTPQPPRSEHIRQRLQPHARLAGDGTGDGCAVDPVQHRQGLVWELEPQHHQRHQHAVAEHQPRLGPGPGRAPTPMAAALGQRGLVLGGPGVGQLGDEGAKVLPRDAGEARMGQGRTDPCWSSHPGMIVEPCSRLHDPTINSAYRAPSRKSSA